MLPSTPTSQGSCLSIATFLSHATEWQDSLLGALCFSADTDANLLQPNIDAPCSQVPMQRLDADGAVLEIWHSKGPLNRGHSGAIQYRHGDAVLFGTITLPETQFIATMDTTSLQQAAESGYRQIFTLLEKLNYPCLFRFWNYMADINAYSHGLERYRQFNLGRQEAFLAHGRNVEGNVPAACALGAPHGPLTIAFLAGRVAATSIENPRQISAYQYPQQYGPRSPTFSRASLVKLEQDEVLFVSGTASIVGHATLHPNDVAAQTRETMVNIEAVLMQANKQAQQPTFDLTKLHYKVYLRHRTDLPLIRAELERIVGYPPNAIYLHADICREDLLVEIEATASQPLTPTTSDQG